MPDSPVSAPLWQVLKLSRNAVIGLDKESVEIIRTVFHQHAVAGKARITNQQIKVVFGKLSLVKSHKQRGVLSNILREYGDDDAELSFAEFLLVLNRLDKSDEF